MSLTAPIKIFSGSATTYLASEITDKYGINLGKTSKQRFSDGEFQVAYEETVRGSHVFIIQSTFQPSDNLFELLLLIDAAKRASAYKIIVVIPYFGFARQDRKDKPRVSIGAKLVADLLEAAGVSRVMTMDLHADQIQGFFNVPVDHLYSSSIFIPYIESLNIKDLVIAAPDMGGSKRAHAYATHLKTPVVISHKSRSKANEIGSMTVIGDVVGKNVIIIDDMIDTAGTITKAADIMIERGANSVRVMATHAILSGPAYDRIEKSSIKELIVTNTIPLKQKSDKITVLSVADIFANTIKNVYNQHSISSNFIF
jgi:ribose-phosphate pyrophosphokinase